MNPEDRLDALLTALRRTEWGQRRDSGVDLNGRQEQAGGGTPMRAVAEDGELAPLLESAQRLAPLRAAQPDPAFARALEERMLTQADEQQNEPGALRRFLAIRSAALRPALVAAVLLLALGLGTLTAASAAGPGSPLFRLHRLEQRLQVGIAGDSTDRAHQHLQLARQWLADVHDAAAQHRGDPTYSDALAALREEDTSAAYEIAKVPAGTQRAALAAGLNVLRADERTTLQAALLAIGWPDRITTTTALGALGVAVPRVTSATLAAGDDGRWHVTLMGAGFESGAVLLVNGQPAGAVTATSDGLLMAWLPLDDLEQAPASLGVGNLDGTAATTDIVQVQHAGAATPTPGEQEGTPRPGEAATATPTPDEQGGQATPTPTDTSGGG
jgi:hypothetical protein